VSGTPRRERPLRMFPAPNRPTPTLRFPPCSYATSPTARTRPGPAGARGRRPHEARRRRVPEGHVRGQVRLALRDGLGRGRAGARGLPRRPGRSGVIGRPRRCTALRRAGDDPRAASPRRGQLRPQRAVRRGRRGPPRRWRATLRELLATIACPHLRGLLDAVLAPDSETWQAFRAGPRPSTTTRPTSTGCSSTRSRGAGRRRDRDDVPGHRPRRRGHRARCCTTSASSTSTRGIPCASR
jgi:hypothetical protein